MLISQLHGVLPDISNADNMWRLMEQLFPLHRTLVGPGYTHSLKLIREYLPLNIAEFPSGQKAFDWTIPKAFKVNAAYVEAPDGSRPIDFERCCYHLWNYSVPFSGTLSRDDLLKHIATDPRLPDAIPLRDSYYRPRWGLSASQRQVQALPEGNYKVHIDTELYDDFLRIGDFYLPGDEVNELLFVTYLCHPLGANDNLSGVVLSVELFKLLEKLPRRRFSYRLIIIPETIGSIVYIANYPDRIKRTLGGFCVSFVGDPGPFNYKKTYRGDTFIDRAAIHVLKHAGRPHAIREYRQGGGDERQFNTPRLRIPMGLLCRTPSTEYLQYHTHLDDLTFVTKEALFESLNVYWSAIAAIEQNFVFEPHYITEPFLSGHDIYPYDLGAGTGDKASQVDTVVQTYFDLISDVDGSADLLSIADRRGLPISTFNRAVADLLRAGLISLKKA
jgi:aminopeptidase-like protein